MKLCISPAQQESLNHKGKLKWKVYCLDKEYGTAFPEDEHYVPLLQPNIGQLIEFLDSHLDSGTTALAIDKGSTMWHVYYLVKNKPATESVELVDALWEEVKEILEG